MRCSVGGFVAERMIKLVNRNFRRNEEENSTKMFRLINP